MNTPGRAATGWLGVLAIVLLVCPASFTAEKVRPAAWAVPVKVDGVPNLFQVTPTLYRSAQPTLQGFKNLEQMGIQTVVNLRGGEDDERAALALGFGLESIPLSAARNRHESNVRVMRLLGRADLGPVLVHCQHGADRTGMILALYRMVYQGWDSAKAIEEMRKGGYGFHSIWGGLVDYLERVDVEALRREIGVTAGTIMPARRVDVEDVRRGSGRTKSLKVGTSFGASCAGVTGDLVGEQGS
jgi:protein tyrosine phosphatase (PTP) superfamily phosphohydrolase (DUF442 family)